MTIRITFSIALLGVVAVGGGTARAERDATPPTVPCEKIIDLVRSGIEGGYRTVLGVVSVPPERHGTQGAFPTGETRWPYFRKAGLVIRGSSPPVTVSVPRAWRSRVAIAWGNTEIGDSLRIGSCPAYGKKPWNAYAGGFYLRSKTARVPLTFRVGRRSATVRFGIGRACNW